MKERRRLGRLDGPSRLDRRGEAPRHGDKPARFMSIELNEIEVLLVMNSEILTGFVPGAHAILEGEGIGRLDGGDLDKGAAAALLGVHGRDEQGGHQVVILLCRHFDVLQKKKQR